MKTLHCNRPITTLKAGKYNDDNSLLLHKHKNVGTTIDFTLYPPNERWCEMVLKTLRNISCEGNTAPLS